MIWQAALCECIRVFHFAKVWKSCLRKSMKRVPFELTIQWRWGKGVVFVWVGGLYCQGLLRMVYSIPNDCVVVTCSTFIVYVHTEYGCDPRSPSPSHQAPSTRIQRQHSSLGSMYFMQSSNDFDFILPWFSVNVCVRCKCIYAQKFVCALARACVCAPIVVFFSSDSLNVIGNTPKTNTSNNNLSLEFIAKLFTKHSVC